VASLEAQAPPSASLEGEWELVYASNRLFVSSPFFLAVAEAFGDAAKSNLFFKLHELQVASWGVSRYGRVSQRVDTAAGVLTSRFTTLLFGLTVIPIIGWGKLLPTFGGQVISIARITDIQADGVLRMELDRTRVEEAPGVALMPLFGKLLIGRDASVGAVWRLLPWNGGRAPTCGLRHTYVDEDMRIARDADGSFFVYCRAE
jgi:hypothetical protein